jgi:hypothetical protein
VTGTSGREERIELEGGLIGLGAAFGLLFGLLSGGELALFVVGGGAIGFGAGAVWDLRRR